jgi:nicotinate-nucleotide pyrophosphorylase (carboxylating)
MQKLDIKQVRPLIHMAREEDLGSGDVTTNLLFQDGTRAKTVIVSREEIVVAGLPVVEEILRQYDGRLQMTAHFRDGQSAHVGSKLATIEGPLRSMLSAERVMLNFLQRLSGIATTTSRYVRAVKGTRAKIYDTRKTLPGWRLLEKYAVRCGGGFNHRFGLDDAILIKDNHIAVAGGIRAVLERARAAAGHLVKIEIEVDSLAQLSEVLDCGLADVVLLDNFDVGSMKKAVDMVAGRLVIEASGGITLDSIAAIAATGVDYASSGALTHSAPALDIGLDIEM